MQDHDPAPELEAIRQLPLRNDMSGIASALKWGLADCDDLSVEADKTDIDGPGFRQDNGSSEIPPDATCPLLKVLVGDEEMAG